MKYLVGVDVGTSGSKGVLVTLDGDVVASHSLEHGMDIPNSGWAEQDADAVWWHDTCTIIRKLLADSGVDPQAVAGVGLSAIGPCMVAVDKEGRAIRPGILYGIDTRAAAQIRRLNDELGSEAIYARTGQILSSQSAGPKILWLQENEPENFARVHKVMTATSYLVMRLTDRIVMDYYTAPFYDPFFNIHAQTWDYDLAAQYFDPDILPDVAWTTDCAGVVTEAAAQITGLAPGTPVITGTVDAASEAVSVGVVEAGQTMVMYGTTFFVIQLLDQLLTSEHLWSSYFCIEGKPILAAGMSTSSALTRWYRDNFAALERQRETETGENAYAQLTQEASNVPPGSDGLVVLPYFSGERTPINDPDARGTILGLTLKHEGRHVFRALLEGAAYSLRHNFDAMEQIGAKPQEIIAVGGGTKSRLWTQIVSDVTGINQVVAETTIGASYGDAYLAGVGAGVFPDYSTLTDTWVKVKEVVRPNPANQRIYDYLYAIYREMYPNLKPQMQKLAVLQRGEGPWKI